MYSGSAGSDDIDIRSLQGGKEGRRERHVYECVIRYRDQSNFVIRSRWDSTCASCESPGMSF